MSERNGELLVGTSDWQYKHWAGVFYPDEIPKKQWFEYYAGRFDTVEINNTFYRLPAAGSGSSSTHGIGGPKPVCIAPGTFTRPSTIQP